tara:strand:+ start:629 stop:1216 length:588 start_codon:yes stop_codon:yes gene_type:complete
MLTADIKDPLTLAEFYDQIRSQQEDPDNHGAGYCAHHDMIQYFMEGCKSYRELGTHQGASAAAALLSPNTPMRVDLVDITMEKLNWQKKLFLEFCDMNWVDINIYEMSSIDPRCAAPVDMLMIDSLHQWKWTEKELALHAPLVNKYIVFHDTTTVNRRPSDIWPGIVRWCEQSGGEWKILKRVLENVGATTIARA